MKKKYIIYILVAIVALFAVGLAIFLKPQGAKIIVATDTHYLSSSVNDGGKAFSNMISNSDGKLVQYCDEIFSAFSDEVVEAKPDVLIISGDLSFNGEKASHLDFAKKLKKIQDSGVQVLTIAGNHDINSSNPVKFRKNKISKSESVDAEEFKSIYFDYGMKQAESVDENSLSYMYKVNRSLYVLMLDTNAFGQNFVQDESYQWIEEQLKLAKKRHASVITVTHQNVLNQSEKLTFGYTLYDAKELLELFQQYKVKCNLSGHVHIQHISQENDFSDIATSSLVVNTTQYGVIDFNGKINYQTKRVDVEAWAKKNKLDNEELLNFSSFSVEFFKQSGRMEDTLKDYGLNKEKHKLVFDAIASLNSSYFAGTAMDTSKIKDGIELCQSLDGFVKGYVDEMLKEAENDYNYIEIK